MKQLPHLVYVCCISIYTAASVYSHNGSNFEPFSCNQKQLWWKFTDNIRKQKPKFKTTRLGDWLTMKSKEPQENSPECVTGQLVMTHLLQSAWTGLIQMHTSHKFPDSWCGIMFNHPAPPLSAAHSPDWMYHRVLRGPATMRYTIINFSPVVSRERGVNFLWL